MILDFYPYAGHVAEKGNKLLDRSLFGIRFRMRMKALLMIMLIKVRSR
jgi:hypothetical protein